MEEAEIHADEVMARGGIPDSEWAQMTPEQRLCALMAVSAAEEEAMPPEVVERATDLYRKQHYCG